MKTTALIGMMIWVMFITAWGCNGYKLTQCDFEKPYKGEVIHAVGLIPVFSIFTVWNNEK